MRLSNNVAAASGRHRAFQGFWGLIAVLMLIVALPVRGEQLTLNLKEADIGSVIETVSKMTGRNFIVDPRVKGKITVISSEPMSADEIYEVFLSILNVHGFAAVPSDGVIKIVPEANAKQDSIPTVTPGQPGMGDQYVTRVIKVENVAAAQLVPILRPLLPQQGHLAAMPSANVLVASAGAANLQRLVEIIKRVDRSSDGELEMVRLEHASASEVARVLTSLQQGADKQAGGATSFVADERTNSIIISGAANRLQLRAIISHLDTPMDAGGNTEVIYLRYANAAEVTTVLEGISATLGPAGGEAQNAGEQEVTIRAHEQTNAVVINATPDVMRSLKSVIARLDIRRAQVYVEAVIAEIRTDDQKRLGIQWAYDGSPDNGPVGLVNFPSAGNASLSSVAGTAAAGGVPSPPGLLAAVGDTASDGSRGGALLHAITSNTNANILSTPTLVTLDNEEAEIVVGQNVPFVTGSYTSTGGDSTDPFQTIEREDVGLTLSVKPQINEGNAVRLELSQEVSSVSTATGATDLITDKRSLKTTVMVDDGQVVVLGGLVDEQLDVGKDKVPGLGDIPGLGWLFKYESTTKVKRNLMIFLRPVILRTEEQNAAIANAKYTFIRDRQQDVREAGLSLMADEASPLLPEYEDFMELPPPFEVWKEGPRSELRPPDENLKIDGNT
ncbi:type II secretion system secretin GspD [Thiohalomonas denitrificans]|uniref:General secretion pathway protein D n=1 Tax=Thiohalomonas denitrificans TaxID=415747 RepID=A0A1G5QCX6_9GAMM|nr:type II secretion system secretin GspD [Thiohalomonas denitrificans]SCZ59654.1 general secretion pathway protein D [Thiohalomonas denitrificans]